MASRKEQKEKLRAERLEREAEAEARASRRSATWKVVASIAAIAVIAAAALVLMLGNRGGGDSGFPSGPASKDAMAITGGTQDELAEAAKAGNCELKTNPDEGRDHEDKSSETTTNPPTSGSHLPTSAEDGAYAPGAEPPTSKLVHSLEHGRVLFQWRDGKISDDQIGSLKRLFDDYPDYLILARNSTNMPYAIAATAWNNSLVCRSASENAFKAMRLFQIVWADRAPEQVPWPAS